MCPVASTSVALTLTRIVWEGWFQFPILSHFISTILLILDNIAKLGCVVTKDQFLLAIVHCTHYGWDKSDQFVLQYESETNNLKILTTRQDWHISLYKVILPEYNKNLTRLRWNMTETRLNQIFILETILRQETKLFSELKKPVIFQRDQNETNSLPLVIRLRLMTSTVLYNISPHWVLYTPRVSIALGGEHHVLYLVHKPLVVRFSHYGSTNKIST